MMFRNKDLNGGIIQPDDTVEIDFGNTATFNEREGRYRLYDVQSVSKDPTGNLWEVTGVRTDA